MDHVRLIERAIRVKAQDEQRIAELRALLREASEHMSFTANLGCKECARIVNSIKGALKEQSGLKRTRKSGT